MALEDALRAVDRPPDLSPQGKKTAYATRLSRLLAQEVSRTLRERGLSECQPDPVTGRGGERRMAGGIGAKNVDVSVATEDMGLVLAVTLKGIYFPDATRLNKDGGLYFAKNLMNRKADLLAEATTLHKRFPYAVVGGLFLFDARADDDAPAGPLSTFRRAHQALAAFSERDNPGDADELIEAMALGKVAPDGAVQLTWAGTPEAAITLDDYAGRVLEFVAERNSDHYVYDGHQIRRR